MGPSNAQGKEEGKKEMPFCTERCQLINVEGLTKIENHPLQP